MDLDEQERAMKKIEETIAKELPEIDYHAIIAIESSPGRGGVFSFGTLHERTPLQTWLIIAGSSLRHVQRLLSALSLPGEDDFNKPVQPK